MQNLEQYKQQLLEQLKEAETSEEKLRIIDLISYINKRIDEI
jgi:hypothetical protein